MKPPDDDHAAAPLMFLKVNEVPRAGHRELVDYTRKRKEIKETCILSMIGAAFCGLVAAAGAAEGAVIYGFFLLLTTFFLGVAGNKLLQLVAGPKTLHALPEGTNEATALLEDATTKAIREWNWAVEAWSKEIVQLDVDAALWKLRREDPTTRPDGWSEESHVWDGAALLARGKAMALKRKRLRARRRMIRHAINALHDRLHVLEQESHIPDPEPEVG
jgi:hypothetical protein